MSKPFPAFPGKIQLAEFQEKWPKDPSGMRARTLMLDYLGTFLIETSIGNTAAADRAQAESAVGKVLARLVENVRSITLERKVPKKITASPPLKRFEGEQQKTQQPKPE